MSVKFTLDGSGAGAVRAVESLNKALEATEKNAEGAVKPTKRLSDQAQRIKESLDPQLKYNRQVEEMAKHVRAGTLTFEQARAKTVQYEAALHKTSKTADEAFGAVAVGKLVAFTGGLAGVATAFKKVEDEAQAAADAVLNSLATAGELQQLGPESFARGASNARKLLRSGAVKDLTQGFEIAQNLENAGFKELDIDYLIEHVAKSRVVSAGNLTGAGTALSKFQTAFGEAETGPMKDLIDKMLYVATIPGVSSGFSQTITESLKFADSFKKIGGTDEEALATFAGVERVSPSAENAAEVIKSFASQVDARGLAKDSFEATFANVKGLVAKAGGNASKVLGDQNAVRGYNRIAENEAFILAQASSIASAQGTLKSNSGLLNQDPSLAAANVRALEEGRLAADTEYFESRRENLFDAARAAQRAREVRNGVNPISRYFNAAADATVDAFGGENVLLRGAVQEAERDPSFLKPETLSEIKRYLADIEANTRDAKNSNSDISRQQRQKFTTRPE
jgi:hypothetical protein